MRLFRFLLTCAVLLFIYGLVMVSLVVPYGGLAVGIIAAVVLLSGKSSQRLMVLGSAKWAAADELPHLLRGNGVIVGEIEKPPVGKWKALHRLNRMPDAGDAVPMFVQAMNTKSSVGLVRLSDAVHTAVFAPTGAGKGRSVVVPYLMETPDTVIAADVKSGELASITAAYRRRKFGQKVFLIDPFRLQTSTPHGIDVMAGLNAQDPRVIDDARAIADALVVIEEGEHDPHWPQRARGFITFAILTTVHLFPEGSRTLQEVAETWRARRIWNVPSRR